MITRVAVMRMLIAGLLGAGALSMLGAEAQTAGEVQVFDGIEFVWCPPGNFTMGSPESERGRGASEGPPHEVTLTKGFWLGKCEVTQEQWEAVMGENPAKSKGASRPVEQVTWDQANDFCKQLSKKSGAKYALPTEAQWEYACRAGSTTPFCFGDAAELVRAFGYYKGNSEAQTYPVGQKLPNAWGLFDMYGNVWEWCRDLYKEDFYASSPGTDPVNDGQGTYRVCRGGSFDALGKECRSANRQAFVHGFRYFDLGFRLCREP